MSESSSNSPSPDPTACTPGQLLGGKYRLVRLLGEGGMGNVWLARNELLDLDVALKIVRPDARGSETTARLLMEARVQANLRHPNVARVFDYGQSPSGDSYLVLEFLEGCSLAEWLEERGAIPPVQAVQILLPVIDALCAAHDAGVVHRDLKPDNIYLARSGKQLCPKLLDFGIAKLEGQFERRLTGSGGVVGSPAYMAPEQARGFDDVDQRVDVWAACVVLYEAVSGKPAFDADNYHALLRNVIETEPEPLADPKLASFWQIVQLGLKKDRSERISSMRELGAALERWLVEQGELVDASPEPLGWRWVEGARDSRTDARPLSGVRSHLNLLGRGGLPELPHSRSDQGYHRYDPNTMHTGERPGPAPTWRMSVVAAVGGGLLALGFGQAWMPVPSEPDAFEEEMAVVQPAAVIPLPDASRAAAPARQQRIIRADLPREPSRAESTRAEPTKPEPPTPEPVKSEPSTPEPSTSEPMRLAVAAAPIPTERVAAKPAEAPKPSPAKVQSPANAAVVSAPPPEPVASRPKLTAADLVDASARPARVSEPVRLTSTYSRTSDATVSPPRSVASPVVQPSAVKRGVASAASEAELGLKSPW